MPVARFNQCRRVADAAQSNVMVAITVEVECGEKSVAWYRVLLDQQEELICLEPPMNMVSKSKKIAEEACLNGYQAGQHIMWW